MWLTGPTLGPGLGPPAKLLALLDSLAARIEVASSIVGRTVVIDPLLALTERAASAAFRRGGRVSCGGATRLLHALDGWVAVTLARADDIAAVPAFTDLPRGDDPWIAVAAFCAASTMATITERAELLALPVGALGERTGADAVVRHQLGTAGRHPDATSIVVADLSSMWAGPLCGAILVAVGCTVVKIESVTRPDGARRGPNAFFDRLHRDKRSATFRFDDVADRARLHDTIANSDVVIEASRPRALQQLGIDRVALQESGPSVWVTITGHGATNNRVGFGDDAAVAGGLVGWSDHAHGGHAAGPNFVADAVADPITGLLAAAEVLEALALGARRYLDVAMAGAAALGAGPTLAVPDGVTAQPPTLARST
jgi:hypothetical protein